MTKGTCTSKFGDTVSTSMLLMQYVLEIELSFGSQLFSILSFLLSILYSSKIYVMFSPIFLREIDTSVPFL